MPLEIVLVVAPVAAEGESVKVFDKQLSVDHVVGEGSYEEPAKKLAVGHVVGMGATVVEFAEKHVVVEQQEQALASSESSCLRQVKLAGGGLAVLCA